MKNNFMAGSRSWNDLRTGFIRHLRLERSVSENTISAYTHDIELLEELAKASSVDLLPENIDADFLRGILSSGFFSSFQATTQSRFLSGVRAFYRYLILEDILEENPVDLLDRPSISRKLPDVLSISEVESVINAIDLSKPEGQRNKAILEILYG